LFTQSFQANFDPFSKLFTIVYKWQKAEKKYMDGDFRLEAEKIDFETDEYFK